MEKEYETYIRAWYDRLAPYYGIFDTIVKGVRYEVVDVAKAPSNARIVDIAMGTGAQAFAFAQRGYVVEGIDLSKGMLRVAQRHNVYDSVCETSTFLNLSRPIFEPCLRKSVLRSKGKWPC